MNRPRVLVAGTKSGCGKTTAVCAILALLKRAGARVCACKCGPDYIDPTFHKSVLGVPCVNLDPFFCEEELLKRTLCENAGRDITVIEGVMGYYDGSGENGTDYSTYSVSRATKTPVILAVDGKGASASLIAAIEGFLHFRPDSAITGVVFSRVTAATYGHLKKLVHARFGDSVRPVGYVPVLPEELVFESRHLGLVTANEIAGVAGKIERIADICQSTLDLNALCEIASSAPELDYQKTEPEKMPGITIAVARDNAFCFYYSETLKLFESMGAKLEFFSPLADQPVPAGASALYLGGGYPELYLQRLARAETAKQSVLKAVSGGMPTVAECGGFQYLCKSIEGEEMCGAIDSECFKTGKLVRFGYITLTARKDSLFGAAGTSLKAHEFHYYDSTRCGEDFSAVKTNGKNYDCAFLSETLYAGYPHLYLPASPGAARGFYEKALEYKEKNK